MSGYGVPEIVGNWIPADQTENRLEFAKTRQTDEQGILAMRSSTRPEVVTPITKGQLRNLPNALKEGGSLAHLIDF